MKPASLPLRRLGVILCASSALSLLSGCIETPDKYKPGSVKSAANVVADPHAGHDMSSNDGTTDPNEHSNHGDQGTTPDTSTDGNTNQQPDSEYVADIWQQASSITASELSVPADTIVAEPVLILDKNGTQFLSTKLSSPSASSAQTFLNIKPSNSASWQQVEPFSNGLEIKSFEIKTDLVSGNTFALWQNQNNELFLSQFDTTTNSWMQAEQISSNATQHTLLINSHGMPGIASIGQNAQGALQFTYKAKMHDGSWAQDTSSTHVLDVQGAYAGKVMAALNADNNPTFTWMNPLVAGGWDLNHTTLDPNNNVAMSTVIAANNTQGIDLTQLMKLGVVSSATNGQAEVILTMHSGEVFSISRMSMDSGVTYMWHTPRTLLDATQAASFSFKPELSINGENALLIWGENHSAMNMTSTADEDPTATENPATDGHAHAHKISSRIVVSNPTNMLKARAFNIANNWGVTEDVAMATSDRLIKHVAPVISFDGEKSVSWIEADEQAALLFASHNLDQGWEKKELITQSNVQQMPLSMPMLGISLNGSVQSVWMDQMSNQSGGLNIQLRNSQSVAAVHDVHSHDGHGHDVTDPDTNQGDNNQGDTDQGSGNNTVVSATWGAPQQIGYAEISYSTQRQFRGPKVTINDSGFSTIFLEKTPEFNISTFSFGPGEYTFSRQFETGEWVPQQAQPPVTAPNAILKSYKVIKATGEIYALWSDQKNLYFNRYFPSVDQWAAAENLNIQAAEPRLIVAESGMATLLWSGQDSVNNTEVIYAKHFMPATGWGAVQHTSVESGAILLSPIVNENNTITYPWLTRTNSHTGIVDIHADLWTANFDPTMGWSTHQQGFHVPDFSHIIPQLYNLTPSMRVATFYNSYNHTLSASIYTEAVGWGEIVNIDKNNGDGNLVIGQPVVSANENGAIIIAWQESMPNSTTGLLQYHYMSITYDMANGWSDPEMIANSPGNDSDLSLKLDNFGHAIATWVTTNDSESMIHVNHYSLGSGWSSSPEMLARYAMETGDLEELASSPSVDINNLSEAIISWDHVINNKVTRKKMHHIQAVRNF